jgi:hypothetical protein
MAITPDNYEKLGAFYLGKAYDIERREVRDEDLVLYDSKDLVTHGVVVGMTGSGKTGLCLSILEEAAMDGVPIIAIDPKGDIGNALLTFPNLAPEEFQPWINPDDARRNSSSVQDYAAAQAKLWRKGLQDWHQGPERIQALRNAVDMAIYTPGSTAGLPVSILSSLDCPPAPILEDREAFADRVESTASSLLGLMGVNADPVQSPEHILLSNILSHCWTKGQNLTLEHLVHHLQQPPMAKIGVVDVETFLPEAKRGAVAMKLNNLIASPSFGTWLEGEPLNIQRMFYTAEGRPRLTIFNIAHLNDGERMFFVSMLLNQLLGWMRAQQGTTSLRALFYMDEIFGYLPPSAMPPSKKPMLILLKQARAFGLGLLLATQNPVDLDYKALSNIGTWWLGRLQTERDKARVLDGLEGAAVRGGGFDRRKLDTMISSLGNRVFLMNNVHEDGPVIMHVRWLMSYLTGPLAADQIRRLMSEGKSSSAPAPQEDAGFLPPTSVASSGGANTFKPTLPPEAAEFFLAPSAATERLCYVPAILRSASVSLDDAKRGITGRSMVTVVNPIDAANHRVIWDKFVDLPRDMDLERLEGEPQAGAEFAELPAAALKASTYAAIRKDFPDWVYSNFNVEIGYSPLLKAHANPGEKLDEFRARIAQKAREIRDQAIETLREKHGRTAKSLEERVLRAQAKVETQKGQASDAKLSGAVRLGTSILGAFFGRRRGMTAISSGVTSASRMMRESREVAAAEADLQRLEEEQQQLEKTLESELAQIREQYETSNLALESVKLSPLKKNIDVAAVGILWLPHERLNQELRPAW